MKTKFSETTDFQLDHEQFPVGFRLMEAVDW